VIEKVFFGLASALVFEGLMLAILPNRIKKSLEIIEKTSASTLSRIGLVLMGTGIFFLSIIEI
jgi:uncharacterized protein YjeT (DUF2065 family)|tara:strand:+ start:207 stop:395 length:189 start_codon:yes stop_codon:yes gene_type:complete